MQKFKVFVIGICVFFLCALCVIATLFLYVSVPGSLLVLLLYTWIGNRWAVFSCIYPGTLYHYKKDLTNQLRSILSRNYNLKLKKLRKFLSALQSKDTSVLSYELVKLNFLSKLQQNYSAPNRKLSKSESSFFVVLNQFYKNLQDISILVNTQVSCSIFEIRKLSIEVLHITQIEATDYSESSPLSKSLQLCTELQKILKNCYKDRPFVHRIHRWYFNDTMGSMDFMREHLKQRHKCEEFTVLNNKQEINCLIIFAQGTQDATILYCGANACYYEYIEYSSDWVEFYTSRGMNLCLWNYRGYGKTKGSPYLPLIVKDGIEVFRYVKQRFENQKIGIHGESIGGCIAAGIARDVNCDFLMADRTFGSLSDNVYFTYGKICYWLFRLSCHVEFNSALLYVQVKCFKVISVCTSDLMINDFASLKAAVAYYNTVHKVQNLRKFFTKKKKHLYLNSVLSEEECSELYKSTNYIRSTYSALKVSNSKEEEKNRVRTGQTDDSSGFKKRLKKISLSLSDFKVANQSLLHVLTSPLPIPSLDLWLMILNTWGQNSNSMSRILKRIINELTSHTMCLNRIDHGTLLSSLESLIKVFTKLHSFVQEKLSIASMSSEEILLTDRQSNLGQILPLLCGHNEPFDSQAVVDYYQKIIESGLVPFHCP